MTTENVVEEQVPVEETIPEAELKEQPPAPLTEERVQQLIVEATTKAVTEAKETGRRELQSEQEKNKAADRRARLAEQRVETYETSLSGVDEDTRNAIELARYREQEKYNQSESQRETQSEQDNAYYQRMNESVLIYLDNMGIPRDHKDLDWGQGSQDYIEARSRLDISVAKIMREEKNVTEGKREQLFKELETKLRGELNLDSVDIPPGGGSDNDSDAEFKKGIGDGTLPLNKTNMARAKKLGIA